MESREPSLLVRIAGCLAAPAAAVLLVAACRTIAATPRVGPVQATAVVTPRSGPVAISPPVPPSVPPPSIRIGIAVEAATASIDAGGGVEVWLGPDRNGRHRGPVRLARATFEPAPEAGVKLVETGEEAGQALVAPSARTEWLATGGSTYRGLLEVRGAPGATLTAVNIVGLEDYVRGVVPNELGAGSLSGIEALKAQAVAARTYALRHLGSYSSRGYDLCATAACQVYRGVGSETPAGNRAVAQTRGILATWRGRPIRAYYTSSCGGHTESGLQVFGDGAPYLRGVACVPEDRAEWPVACERATHEDPWQVSLTPVEVSSSLARYGGVGSVRDLAPRRIGVSGRVVELSVVGTDGEMLLKGLRVSSGLGVPESLFVIGRELAPDGAVERFVITGLGRGHGVGLCQLGAAAMARRGATYDAILKHYYTGITLSDGA